MRVSNKKDLLLIDWSESIWGGDIFFLRRIFLRTTNELTPHSILKG